MPKPHQILAFVMWALFIILGLLMTLERISINWIGVIFLLLCFLVAILASVYVGGGPRAKQP